jgi:hypothetical protein
MFSVIDNATHGAYLPTMGREKQTATRYPRDIVERLEALVGPSSTAMHKATMSDVLRTVVAAGLPLVEKAYGAKAPVDMSDPMMVAQTEARDDAIEGPCASRKWGPSKKGGGK